MARIRVPFYQHLLAGKAHWRWLALIPALALACSASNEVETASQTQLAIDQNADVVISEVYVGSGPDYVKIFNRGTTPVTQNFWSIQMGNATGAIGGPGQRRLLPQGVLQPGQTIRVWLGLHTPLANGWSDDTVPLATGGGKIALVRGTTPLNCGSTAIPCTGNALVSIADLFGFGGANFFEGASAAPAFANDLVALRDGVGHQDTNENAQDFRLTPPSSDSFAQCNPNTIIDPRTLVPVSTSLVTGFADAARPLYEGTVPLQRLVSTDSTGRPIITPIASGTIDPVRVAVIQGRALTATGASATCADVSVVNQPDFGVSSVTQDGSFSIAVNGGVPAILKFAYPGFITVYRTVTTLNNQFSLIGDIRLVPLSPAVTVSSAASSTTVVAGSLEQDAQGSRRAALFFPPGTTATVAGESTPRTTFGVRLKELTNLAATGRDAMPASLPPQSAFTYAAVLELEGAESKDVTFNNPIPFYVENFLNFPNGEDAPVGRFSPQTGQWMAEPNGRVLTIVGVSGGQALLDIDDTQGADDPSFLGVTPAELSALATRYAVGTSLWRFQTNHFSAYDINWGWGAPPGAAAPPTDGSQPSNEPYGGCESPANSTIECENQVLREEIPLAATPFSLIYSSGRQRGSARELLIPVSSNSLPAGLKRMDLQIQVAGQQVSQSFAPQANYTHGFLWNGVDIAGRYLNGVQQARVGIGYVYDGSYASTARFGEAGDGIFIAPSRDRFEATLWRYANVDLGTVDAHYPGLGGWTIDVHHVYEPVTGTIYYGNGKRKLGNNSGLTRATITTFAGNGGTNHSGDGGPATMASIDPATQKSSGIAVAPDGTVYFTDFDRIRKVDKSGTISRLSPSFDQATGVAVDAAGNVYVAESRHCRVQKIDVGGNLSTVAGATNPNCITVDPGSFPGHDGPADPNAPGAATFTQPTGLAMASDGSLYVVEQLKVRRIRDGQVSTVVTADQIDSNISSIALGADGSLFIGASTAGLIGKLGVDGSLTLAAGGGSSDAEGVQYNSARVGLAPGLAVGPDGLLYFAQSSKNRVRRVNLDGSVQTIAGTSAAGFSGDGDAATRAKLNSPSAIYFGPDGTLFIVDLTNRRVRRVIPKDVLGLSGGDFGLASEDGQQLYQFDVQGRHKKTIDTHTGAAIYTFGYDSQGSLASIADVANRTTIISRSGGNVTITAPDQQQTTLLLDSNNNLQSVTQPDGGQWTMTYQTGSMLSTLTDPKANAEGGSPATYQYQNGRLTQDTDGRPGASPHSLARTLLPGANGWVVDRTTPNHKTTEYKTEFAAGIVKRTITHPDQTQAIEQVRQDGNLVFTAPNNSQYDRYSTLPDGTQVWTRTGQHPTYGGLTDLVQETQTRLPSGLTRIVSESTATTSDSSGILQSEVNTTAINGQSASQTFDPLSRTYTSKSRAGRNTFRQLDSSGRPSQLRVAGILNAFNLQYDLLGRLFTTTQGTRTTQLGYFPTGSGVKSGYLQTTQTGLGTATPLSSTTFDRDAMGRILQATIGGNTTATTFDANGNLATVTPPGKPTHSLSYDAVNLLSVYTPPVTADVAAPATSYSYDPDRAPTLESRPGSVSLVSAYDSAGRLDTVTFPGGLLDPSYYGLAPPAGGAPGRLSAISGPYGVNLAFQYDGPLTTKTTWSGSISGSVASAYNPSFLPSSRTVTPGTGAAKSLFLGYDADDLTTCASFTSCTPATNALGITRDPNNGRTTTLTLGNITESYNYNDFGELASQSANFSGSALETITYDTASNPRDALGRITRKVEAFGASTNTFDYAYDAVGRLTDVTLNGTLQEHFGYDANGNRTQRTIGGPQTSFYDDQDRLTSGEGFTYTYAPNGELATKTETATGKVWTYTYDALGNLLSVALPGGPTVSYLVDGQGRRVGKRVGSSLVKQWLYGDGLHPIAELDGNGALVAFFVYASGGNAPDFIVRGNTTYRVLSDQLGSPRMVVNATNSNDVPFRADYSSFGVQTMLAGAADWMPFGFAGGMYDSDTGLVRFGARDYDPSVGRWVSKDPIRFGGGQNIYAYVNNDPVNRRDPLGLWPAFEEMTFWEELRAVACIYFNIGCDDPKRPIDNGPVFSPDYNQSGGELPPAGPPANDNGDGPRGVSCMDQLHRCLGNKRQPENNCAYGPFKDCGACYRECVQQKGRWPYYKCPD